MASHGPPNGRGEESEKRGNEGDTDEDAQSVLLDRVAGEVISACPVGAGARSPFAAPRSLLLSVDARHSGLKWKTKPCGGGGAGGNRVAITLRCEDMPLSCGPSRAITVPALQF